MVPSVPTPSSDLVLQVSLVTDVSFLLGKYVNGGYSTVSSCDTSFNSSISYWNTGSATTMR
jgi:hypothetical protein